MLKELRFDNTFTNSLPADSESKNFRRQVRGACYSRVQPTPVKAPKLVAYSREMVEALGLSEADARSEDFLEVFSGNRLLEGMEPYAACYGGHQFGNWAGQLGDGRAIGLGEVVGKGGKRWELQLKGAGPTPYSRSADGLAVLRSSVREFLCSEAMYHLGVPTTRALSLVVTGEDVLRDMFYDGNAAHEPGAVVCRVSPTFIRFGNFEIFASRGEAETLKTLTDYTIAKHFPHLSSPSGENTPEVYLRFFEEVCKSTAEMIAHWMRVGFVHGVMNTDNMSILGLTIDYGPYGWLEDYDLNWTPNTTDAGRGRYRFGHQPVVGQWNLAQLGSALFPLVSEVEPLQAALASYNEVFDARWTQMMADKLGLATYDDDVDKDLVDGLHKVLQLTETDMTIFYRRLADLDVGPDGLDAMSDEELLAPVMEAYYKPEELVTHRATIAAWLRAYLERVACDERSREERRTQMNRVNPRYVLRNYLAQLAIDEAEKGDFALVNELLDVLRRPYDDQPGKERFEGRRPEWARHRPGCSMLSCSS